ncbi:MAG: AMP-binding protein [Gammaproteobacteria bacterium]|nr:AMP-binding protein [Gammaproteobacteria bacterium]
MSAVTLDRLVRPGGERVPGTLDPDAVRVSVSATARAVHARGGGDWLIHENDPFRFVVGLYGTVLGRGSAVLLPDVGPATVEAAGGRAATRLGEGGMDVLALAAEGGDGGPPDVAPGTVITLTSGSTGERKRLTRRLEHLLGEADALDARWPRGEACITASMVSSHHMYGLMFAVVWPLARGDRVLAAPISPAPDFAALEIGERRPLTLVTSPSYLHRMRASLAMARFEDAAGRPVNVVRLFSAGAPLDPDAARFAAAHLDCQVNEIYGSTETGAVAARRGDAGERWRALPGVALCERDGHLEIDAPYAALELPRPYASADRVRFEDDGFELLGRSDRVVKVEGRRVSLQSVEDAARRVGGVIDSVAGVGPDGRVALAAVLDEAGTGRLHADGKATMDGELRAALGRELEAVAVPRRVRFLGRVPRDSHGKVRAGALDAVFAADARSRPTVHGESRRDGWLLIELALDPDLAAFTGHFPGFPVLPGVALVHWAACFAETGLGVRASASRLEDVKFMSILAPGDELTLSLRNSRRGIEFRYHRAGVVCAKGRIVVDEPRD